LPVAGVQPGQPATGNSPVDSGIPRPYGYSRMEIPSKVSVFNEQLQMKGKAGTLVSINEGFYEVIVEVQQRNHTVLLPIAETVVIFNEAIPNLSADFEIER
jgi:hypothetical protein